MFRSLDVEKLTDTQSISVFFAGISRKKRSIPDQNDDASRFVGLLRDTVYQVCLLTKQTVNSNIALFIASSMFVKEIMPSIQFYDEVNATLIQFQQRISIEFIQTLNLIRTTIQGNALMTVFSTNWQIIRANKDLGRNASFYNLPVRYVDPKQNTSCSCATLQTCTVPAQFFNPSDQSYFAVESMAVGCYTLEAIIQSSFACFYDLECASKLSQAIGQPIPNRALDPAMSRFSVNDTFETLTNEMFIESWTTNVSYERFFNSCAATSCTYREYYRFDALELLTTFLSVYAGLSFGIRFLVPHLIRMTQKIRNRFRVAPRQE